ncbi:hypothetical protein C7T94_12610 [Pedobacter yulinensis]|uniref:N-acetyltransferase domain-containing protein n=1 Tax=Pedobacter yulinensis TaxID=2126353 RepID=A0A2T3HLV6_9SPHI|nr:GNAT family N-acetyltransferase [Pedobacter yulinensis]PST83406.1 hypothetical protein C7T94_12610 [Pedobacter yulinensis]
MATSAHQFTHARSKRLLFGSLTPADIDRLAAGFCTDSSLFPAGVPGAVEKGDKACMEQIKQETASGLSLWLTIRQKENEKFAGTAALRHLGTPGLELRLWLAPEARGLGFGTECVRFLVSLAKKQFQFRYLYFLVEQGNKSGITIGHKLGFEPAAGYDIRRADGTLLRMVEFRKSSDNC